LRLSLRKALSVHRLLSGFHLDPLSPPVFSLYSVFSVLGFCAGKQRHWLKHRGNREMREYRRNIHRKNGLAAPSCWGRLEFRRAVWMSPD